MKPNEFICRPQVKNCCPINFSFLLSGVTVQKLRAPAVTPHLTPITLWPSSQTADKTGLNTCTLKNMTAWQSLTLTWKKKTSSVRQMIKIKKKFLPHKRKPTHIKPKQRGISCFSSTHSSQNSTAWQGGCYRSYHRLHYNGQCGKETSLIVFSQASFQTWGLSGPPCSCYHCRSSCLINTPCLHQRFQPVLHNPHSRPYLKLFEHMEEGVLYKQAQIHNLIFFWQCKNN